MFLLKLFFNAFIGGIAGFYTNNIAIKMLFKKYSFFGKKYGGVIEDQYNEFIESMSKLVEKDLINHHTLSGEIDSQKFKNTLNKIIKQTISYELLNNSGSVRIKELNGIDDTFNNLYRYTDSVKDDISSYIFSIINKQKIGSFVSPRQYLNIVGNILEKLDIQSDKIENTIENLIFNFLKNKKISDIISDRALDKILDNVNSILDKKDFREFDSLFDRTYEEFLEIINIDSILADIAKSLDNMRLEDFVNDSNNLSKALIEHILELATSKEGKELISQLAESFIKELSHINVKIDALMNKSFKKILNDFIDRELPNVISKIIDLINKNRDNIENLVNTAVDEELSKSFSGKIIRFVKDIFIKNLAQQMGVVKKIVDAIEKYGEDAPVQLSNMIKEYLNTNTLGDIICGLKDTGVLKSSVITKIIINNIKRLPKENVEFIDNLLGKRIGDFAETDLSFVKRDFLPHIFDKIKNEYLYDSSLKSDLTQKILNSTNRIKKINITDLVKRDLINIDLSSIPLYDFLSDKYDNVKEIPLSVLKIPYRVDFDIRKILSKLDNTELSLFYKQLDKKETLDFIEKETVSLIKNNLKSKLKGNVANTVKKELDKSNPKEISAMVEDFMGKELKPINFIGAGLGAIIGGLLFYFSSGFGNVSILWSFIFSIITLPVYAFIGWGTNKFAIKMLFRPYSLKYFFKILPKVSPFIGVVPWKKSKFADNISDFVNEKLLSESSLKDLFAKNRNYFYNYFIDSISKNNFEIADDLLKNNNISQKASSFTIEKLTVFILDNKNYLAQKITDYIEKEITKNIDDSIYIIKDKLIEEINKLDFSEKLSTLITEKLGDKKIGNESLKIASFVNGDIKKLFNNFSNDLNIDDIETFISKYKKEYNNFVNKNSLASFAGESLLDDFTKTLTNLIINEFKTGRIVNLIIDYFKKEEFNPHSQLRDIFGGILPKLLKENFEDLLDIALEEIKSKKYTIRNDILSEMNFLIKPIAGGYVGPILDNILDRKVPKFIKQKKRNVVQIIDKLLDYRLDEIGITTDTINENKIKETLNKLSQKKVVKNSIVSVVSVFVSTLSKLSLKSFLKIIDIRRLSDFINIIKPLISDAVNNVIDRIDSSEEQILKISENVVVDIIVEIFENVKVKEFLTDVNLKNEASHVINKLKNDSKFKQEFESFVLKTLFIITEDNEFYNRTVLKNDIETFLGIFAEYNIDEIKNSLLPYINDFILKINSILDVKTKRDILQYFAEAILNTVEVNLENIIESVNVKDVVNNEINNMHPKEIESLFNSFAKDYFQKLIFYGFPLGAVFGIIPLVIGSLIKFVGR